MHRLRVPMLVTLLVIASFIAIPHITAQDSPPATPGASIDFFVGVRSERAPGQTIYLIQFTLQPGNEIPAHGHPGTTILVVESGNLGWTLLQGTGHVVRSAERGGATEEITEPGADVILGPGDTVYYEDDTTHTARNASDVPVKVMATHILETGQPLQSPAGTPMAAMEMTATPSP
jgi:quercetin dioxygenase-like cupin family protein